MDAQDSQQTLNPSVLFLLGTLLLTSCATGMLCAAIMTDHWEYVEWNQTRVVEIAQSVRRNFTSPHRQISVEWYLDDYVTRIAIRDLRKRHRQGEGVTEADVVAAVFLVPMNGGIWTLCVSLTPEQVQLLQTIGFTQTGCINYLSPVLTRGEETRPDWQHRMQNLSISCALVCLIILGCSALVGAFGILKHQISAVLVTGVMYLLAVVLPIVIVIIQYMLVYRTASSIDRSLHNRLGHSEKSTFALFTLTIIHFKRQQGKSRTSSIPVSPQCLDIPAPPLADGVSPSSHQATDPQYAHIWADYYGARVFSLGWSVDLGWGGVLLCVLASVLWLLLSKMMRYNPRATATLLS